MLNFYIVYIKKIGLLWLKISFIFCVRFFVFKKKNSDFIMIDYVKLFFYFFILNLLDYLWIILIICGFLESILM